jgi:hypothetical protein
MQMAGSAVNRTVTRVCDASRAAMVEPVACPESPIVFAEAGC